MFFIVLFFTGFVMMVNILLYTLTPNNSTINLLYLLSFFYNERALSFQMEIKQINLIAYQISKP